MSPSAETTRPSCRTVTRFANRSDEIHVVFDDDDRVLARDARAADRRCAPSSCGVMPATGLVDQQQFRLLHEHIRSRANCFWGPCDSVLASAVH